MRTVIFYQQGQTKMKMKRLKLRLSILTAPSLRVSSQLNTAISLCSVKDNTLRKLRTTTPTTSVIQGNFVMAILKGKTVAWKSNSLNGRGITHLWASLVLHNRLWAEDGVCVGGNAQIWLWQLNLIFTKDQWFIGENLRMQTLKAIAMW